MEKLQLKHFCDDLTGRQTIAGMFLRQAKKAPQSLAVADEQGSVTYAQLARLAGGIAEQILTKTGDEKTRICILAAQDIPAVAGMLGVLLAGKCFVPLQPQENDDYLRYLWENSESSVIVCAGEHEKRAAAICGRPDRVVVAGEARSPRDVWCPRYLGDPDGISAIMYTSGSTGRPKGVMTTGQAIFDRALQYIETARITSSDRQAAFVPWQFASSFPDIFGPLLAGATLFLYDGRIQGVERLGAFIQKNGITLLKLPASLMKRFIQSVSPDDLRSVRYVYCGGGVQTQEARQLLSVLPDDAALLHGYASTETNLVAFARWRLSDPVFTSDPSPLLLPAGYPVTGKRIQVVDENRNPAAAGKEGELVVVSRSIFRGYFRQPEMTAHDLKELPGGERAFYTGDLGRLREDGCLEITGRKGNRVKIRGLRIDLGAVDSITRSLPYVRDAATASVSSSGREAQLIAYLELAENKMVTATQLREDLKKRLPAYMIPSRFVFVENLPKTASGKIDRMALPPPGGKRPGLANPYEPPRTELEKHLADIWAEILDLDEVGIHDPFVELGGDSLKAVELGLRLEHEFADDVNIGRLLQVSTIARMTQMIQNPNLMTDEPITMKLSMRERLDLLRRRIKRGDLRAPDWLARFLPPYEVFVRLQTIWLFLMPVRLLLGKKIAVFHKWLLLTGQTDDSGELLLNYLRANTWVWLRNHYLAQTEIFHRCVKIDGWEHLHHAAVRGEGTILVFPHAHLIVKRLRDKLISPLFAESYRLGQSGLPESKPAKTYGLAERLKEARNVLARGGAVWIAGDGQQGRERLVLTRYGRRFPFRAGAAELSARTGASLIPVFPSLRPDGTVDIEFLPPLTSEGNLSVAERADDLLRQYSEIYVARWPKMLSCLRSGRLNKRLKDLPRPEPWT